MIQNDLSIMELFNKSHTEIHKNIFTFMKQKYIQTSQQAFFTVFLPVNTGQYLMIFSKLSKKIIVNILSLSFSIEFAKLKSVLSEDRYNV